MFSQERTRTLSTNNHTIPRDSWLFLAYWATIGLVFMGAEGVVRNLYLVRIGIAPDQIGLLEGIAAATGAIFAIPAGIWGSHASNRKLAILGAACWGIGLLGLPAVEVAAASSRFTWLIGVHVLRGIAPALFVSNFTAFVSAATRSEAERRHVFSRVDAAFPAGKSLGALIGGALPALVAGGAMLSVNAASSYRTTLWIIDSIGAAAIVLLLVTRPQARMSPTTRVAEQGDGITIRALLPLFLAVILFAILHVMAVFPIEVFFSLYMNSVLGAAPGAIGLAMGIGQALGVVAAMLVPVLASRFGPVRTAVLALALTAAGGALVSLVPVAGAAFAAVVSVLAANAIVLPLTTSLHQSRVPGRWRSSISSVWFAAGAGARMIVAAGSGALIVARGYQPVFGVSAIAAVGAAIVFVILYRIPPVTARSSPLPGE